MFYRALIELYGQFERSRKGCGNKILLRIIWKITLYSKYGPGLGSASRRSLDNRFKVFLRYYKFLVIVIAYFCYFWRNFLQHPLSFPSENFFRFSRAWKLFRWIQRFSETWRASRVCLLQILRPRVVWRVLDRPNPPGRIGLSTLGHFQHVSCNSALLTCEHGYWNAT